MKQLLLLLAMGAILLTGCTTMKRYNDLEKQYISSQEALSSSQNETKGLQTQIDSLRSEVQKWNNTISVQDTLISQLQSLTEQKKADLDRLSAEKKQSETQLANLQQEATRYQQIVADLNQQQANYEKYMSDMKQKQADYEAQVAKMNADQDRYKGLMNSLQSELDNKSVTIQNLEGKLTVTFVNEVLFASGSAVVTEQGKQILLDFARGMNSSQQYRIEVIGHTDNAAITGKLAKVYPTNWELSTARAVAVVRFLVEAGKMDPEVLFPAGHAFYSPVDTNDTVAGRAKNRRVELVITPKLESKRTEK